VLACVQVRYGGGEEWFAGRVTQRNGDGSYDVAYDDGDSELSVNPAWVRLPVHALGDRVDALFGGGEDWYAGTITAVAVSGGVDGDDGGRDGAGWAYAVTYDDGDFEGSVTAHLVRAQKKNEATQGTTAEVTHAPATSGKAAPSAPLPAPSFPSSAAAVLSSEQAPAPSPTPPTSPPQPAPSLPPPSTKARLVALYAKHNLDKLGDVDALVAKYIGREDAMWAAYRKKYGNAAVDEAWALADAPSVPGASPPAASPSDSAPSKRDRSDAAVRSFLAGAGLSRHAGSFAQAGLRSVHDALTLIEASDLGGLGLDAGDARVFSKLQEDYQVKETRLERDSWDGAMV